MSNQTSGLQKLVQELLEVSKTLILLGDGADYHRTVCKSLTEIAKFWQERFLASDPAGKSDKVIASYINVLREVTEYVKEVRKPGSFSQTALVNLKRAAKSNNACIASLLIVKEDLGEKMKNAVIPLIDSDKVMSENFSNTNSHHKDFDTLILMMFLSKGAKIQDSGEYEINLNPSKFEDSITEVPKERDWIKYVIEISKANDHFNVPVEKGIKQKVFEELKKKKKKEFFTSSDSHFDGEKTLFTKKPMNMQNNIINTSITLSHKDKDKATEFNIRIIKLHDPKDNIEVQKRIYQGKIVTVRKINNVDQNNYQSFQRYSRIINLLSRNNHIEKYYGTLKSSNGLYVVSEWVANDNLHKYLKNEKNISWVIKLKLAEGISSGLTFCHEAEILYNDLSSENILLDDNINPKLSNFGLSRITNPGRISLAGQPTGIRYAAPELILEYQIPYSKAMDVYR
ncbi:10268_t:CDS:2 [Ambispora gerdemannii]|uniref:10268_t:CDS:1 n=1 Tax=Ambispora gerdemannii TaxID=144530 RepID=A0A9N9BMM5_9GLOM|nr:10268_t:CDS:2 [Ambispora gerdemannii]